MAFGFVTYEIDLKKVGDHEYEDCDSGDIVDATIEMSCFELFGYRFFKRYQNLMDIS